LFKYFPDKIRPLAALIVGGKGARSFLHRDPYDWIGWNYLFSGKKLCKWYVIFLAFIQWIDYFLTFVGIFYPEETPIDLIQGRNLIPNAWNMKHYSISSGMISDIDLFENYSSLKFSQLMDPTIYKYIERLIQPDWRGWVEPIVEIFNDYCELSEYEKASYGSLPVFFSSRFRKGNGGKSEAIYPDVNDFDTKYRPTFVEQKEGEMVVIPPGYWHQVYHLESSIAVASQFFNADTKERVYRHMFEWAANSRVGHVGSHFTDKSQQSIPMENINLTDEQQVLYVIQKCLRLKYGTLKGRRLYRNLRI
jgi:hypothetical protein